MRALESTTGSGQQVLYLRRAVRTQHVRVGVFVTRKGWAPETRELAFSFRAEAEAAPTDTSALAGALQSCVVQGVTVLDHCSPSQPQPSF